MVFHLINMQMYFHFEDEEDQLWSCAPSPELADSYVVTKATVEDVYLESCCMRRHIITLLYMQNYCYPGSVTNFISFP